VRGTAILDTIGPAIVDRKQLVTVNYDFRPEAKTTQSIVGIIPQRLQKTSK